jgi:phospholipase C
LFTDPTITRITYGETIGEAATFKAMSRPRRWIAALALLGLAAAAAIVVATRDDADPPAPISTATGIPHSPRRESNRYCGWKAALRGQVEHVVMIVMENKSFTDIVGSADAPFENELVRDCGVAMNYHGIAHPSLPNYIALSAGSTLGVTNDGSQSEWRLTAPTLFAQAGSWGVYAQSMVGTCRSADSYPYQSYHNPPTYFTSLRRSCPARDRPLGSTSAGPFASALRRDTLPRLVWIVPDQQHNMHDGTVAEGDAWLKEWIDAISRSRAYASGRTVVFVTWDEDDDKSSGPSLGESRIPTFVVAPSVRPGTAPRALFDHYSLLRTIESLLGLAPLGRAAGAADMREVFGLGR